MIAFDEEHWPRVEVRCAGCFTLADATAQLIFFSNLLRRQEPFGLLVLTDGGHATADDVQPGAIRIAGGWLAAARPLLATWCRGVAHVTSDQASANWLVGQFESCGCAAKRFADMHEAQGWLHDRVVAAPTAGDADVENRESAS